MKLTSTTIKWLIAAFVWCIVMGVTFVSMGVGSEFPQLNFIAGPFVCPGGQMKYGSHYYQVSPVESGYTVDYYCVNNRTGAQSEIGFWPKHLIAGTFYGLLMVLVGFSYWYISARWGSNPVMGNILSRIAGGIGILLLVFVIGVGVLPLFYSPTSASTAPKSGSTTISTVPPAPTLLGPAAGPPTIENIDRSKAVHSANGLYLSEMAEEAYPPADFAKPGTLTFTVHMPHPVASQWGYEWCAATSKTLAANLKSLVMNFVLDGQSVPLSDFAAADSPGKDGEACHAWFVVLDHWPTGVHHLTTTATFTSTINDGKSDYAAGDYVEDYTVDVQP